MAPFYLLKFKYLIQRNIAIGSALRKFAVWLYRAETQYLKIAKKQKPSLNSLEAVFVFS